MPPLSIRIVLPSLFFLHLNPILVKVLYVNDTEPLSFILSVNSRASFFAVGNSPLSYNTKIVLRGKSFSKLSKFVTPFSVLRSFPEDVNIGKPFCRTDFVTSPQIRVLLPYHGPEQSDVHFKGIYLRTFIIG
jgi:hypothetical protein